MTIAQLVAKEIYDSQLYTEALSIGIANMSSIARLIKPDIEKSFGGSISEAAIIMAIKRLPFTDARLLDKSVNTFLQRLGDITVRSDLSDHTFANSPSLPDAQRDLLELIKADPSLFYSACKGVHETTIISSKKIGEQINLLFLKETMISKRTDLAAVSVILPPANLDTHGIYYEILKKLAWQGINIV